LGQSEVTAGHPIIWELAQAHETVRLGAALAHQCPWDAPGPRVLWLSGELGSGKTTLAAAVLAALGVTEAVRSPTYALIETYPIAQRLAVHVDLYRLQGADELRQLGLRDYLIDQTLLVVEWPERAQQALPRPDLALTLEFEGDGRRCHAQSSTDVGARWLAGSVEEMAGRLPRYV
jgi:tRNA threonylcarbamoyladenosine biosynthesis protein TsaE